MLLLIDLLGVSKIQFLFKETTRIDEKRRTNQAEKAIPDDKRKAVREHLDMEIFRVKFLD